MCWSNFFHIEIKTTSYLFLSCADNLRNSLIHICCFGFMRNDWCGTNRSDTWKFIVLKKLGGVQRIFDNSEHQGQILVLWTYFKFFLCFGQRVLNLFDNRCTQKTCAELNRPVTCTKTIKLFLTLTKCRLSIMQPSGCQQLSSNKSVALHSIQQKNVGPA